MNRHQQLRTDGLVDPHIQAIYDRTKGPVAFMDESYRVSTNGHLGSYVIAASVIPREHLPSLRRGLIEANDGLPWHTTKEAKAGRIDRIETMLELLAQWTAAEKISMNVLTVAAPLLEESTEGARQACLQTLVRNISHSPSGPQALIMDSRNWSGESKDFDANDRHTVSALRAMGGVNPQARMRHADDFDEVALWTADLVAWAYRRVLFTGDTRWWEPLKDCSVAYHARSGKVIADPLDIYRADTPRPGLHLLRIVQGRAVADLTDDQLSTARGVAMEQCVEARIRIINLQRHSRPGEQSPDPELASAQSDHRHARLELQEISSEILRRSLLPPPPPLYVPRPQSFLPGMQQQRPMPERTDLPRQQGRASVPPR